MTGAPSEAGAPETRMIVSRKVVLTPWDHRLICDGMRTCRERPPSQESSWDGGNTKRAIEFRKKKGVVLYIWIS